MIIYMIFVHTTAALGLKALFTVDFMWQTLLWAYSKWVGCYVLCLCVVNAKLPTAVLCVRAEL